MKGQQAKRNKGCNKSRLAVQLIQTLQAPTILTNRGWSFIVYEPNSRTPFKPGIVASAPGSQLHFEVDTSRALSPPRRGIAATIEGESARAVNALPGAHRHRAAASARRSSWASSAGTREPAPALERRSQLLVATMTPRRIHGFALRRRRRPGVVPAHAALRRLAPPLSDRPPHPRIHRGF